MTRPGQIAARARLAIAATAALLAGAPWLGAMPARAATGSEICDQAAQYAADRTGVPLAVLRAVSLTETGRRKDGRFEPWPWTVNMEGKGVWFDDPQAALEFALRNRRRGATSFDVGCFQLNFKWHGKSFASIEEMFQPEANALYAARFLADLYREKGDWTDAAAAYHSRTPTVAARYRARFARILAGLDDRGPASRMASAEVAPERAPSANLFPLLRGRAETQGNLGSLFPTSAGLGNARLIAGS